MCEFAPNCKTAGGVVEAFLPLFQGLHCLISVLPTVTDNYELGLEIAQRLWVTNYDSDENVQRLAQRYILINFVTPIFIGYEVENMQH